MKIRRCLQKRGFKVGQIGTEPSSLLYGLDYVYPMGYNSSVYIKEFDAIRYLNYIINQLCLVNKDIIIVGSQSGTLPYDTGNLALFNIPQYNFLLGTQPDAVILCVNPFDDLFYIERTKNFIESSIECKVIALVVFPMNLKDNWAGIYGGKIKIDDGFYIRFKDELSALFNIPIYRLDYDDDIECLIENIISFFS